jgi:hypothetical protein
MRFAYAPKSGSMAALTRSELRAKAERWFAD